MRKAGKRRVDPGSSMCLQPVHAKCQWVTTVANASRGIPTAEQHPVEMSKYGQICVHAYIDDYLKAPRLMVDG